jgi:aryl-alcohol dehydrogenase-like predicted oxidoreductase
MPQVALAWLLAQRSWIVPIPGTSKLHRLEENIGGADLALTETDLRELNDLLASRPVQGHRYNDQLRSLIKGAHG